MRDSESRSRTGRVRRAPAPRRGLPVSHYDTRRARIRRTRRAGGAGPRRRPPSSSDPRPAPLPLDLPQGPRRDAANLGIAVLPEQRGEWTDRRRILDLAERPGRAAAHVAVAVL